MKHLKFLFLIIVLGVCFSCEKKNEGDIFKETAILTWQGEIALDGCGFWVKINGKEYKPVNEDIIDVSYEIVGEKIRVEIEYKLLEKNVEYYCGLSNTPMNVGKIEIISIKKK